MINWLFKIITKFWLLPDNLLKNPDIIVPHGYGLISYNELPDASIKTILKSVEIIKKFPKAKIIFSSSNYFWSGCKEQEDKLKFSLLLKSGVSEHNIVITKGIGNTIQEIRAIRSKIKEFNYIEEIAVIVDQMHARRAKIIWQKLIPEIKIKIININGIWDYKHPSKLQKSEKRWLLTNIAFCILFILRGEKIINIHHSISH